MIWDDAARVVRRRDGSVVRPYNPAELRALEGRQKRVIAAHALPDIQATLDRFEAWFRAAAENPDAEIDLGAAMQDIVMLARQVGVLTEIVTGLVAEEEGA